MFCEGLRTFSLIYGREHIIVAGALSRMTFGGEQNLNMLWLLFFAADLAGDGFVAKVA